MILRFVHRFLEVGLVSLSLVSLGGLGGCSVSWADTSGMHCRGRKKESQKAARQRRLVLKTASVQQKYWLLALRKLERQLAQSTSQLQRLNAATRRIQRQQRQALKRYQQLRSRLRLQQTIYKTSVRECKQTLRKTFSLASSAAQQRLWQEQCETVFNAVALLLRKLKQQSPL